MRFKEERISEKKVLTLEEAAAYTGIGINTLRKICDDTGMRFCYYIGNKRHINREKLVKYLEESRSILCD